jgi:zinc transporter ZupT
MLTGFVLIILAGIAYYAGPRSGHTVLYATLGNYLMAAGFVVYLVGRIVRGRARRTVR